MTNNVPVYFDTDAGKLYRDENGTPVEITTSGGSATLPWSDPYAFGAVGDGVADDTQALTDAMMDAQTNTGCFYLPAGEFLVTDTIPWANNVTIKGHGIRSKIIGDNLTGKPVVETIGGNTYRTANCYIENIWIDNQSKTNTGSIGLSLRNAVDFHMRNVIVSNVETAVSMYGDNGVAPNGSYYNSCYDLIVANAVSGLVIDSPVTGSNANENRFMYFRSTVVDYPIDVKSGNSISFFHPCMEGFVTGIRVRSGVEDVSIYTPRAENGGAQLYTGLGVQIDSGAVRTRYIHGHYSGIATPMTDAGSGSVNLDGSTPSSGGGGGGGGSATRYFILEMENNGAPGLYHTGLRVKDASGYITLTAGMLTNPNGGLAGFSAANLVDGNTGTNGFHTDSAGVGSKVVIDFGSGNDKLLTEVEWHVNGSVTASWKGIQSTNGTSGTTVFTGLNCAGGAGTKIKTI